MATDVTTERTVFVLGREVDGNREALIVDSGKEYTLDPETIVEYSDESAEFPYGV
jgi:hypothetical protein